MCVSLQEEICGLQVGVSIAGECNLRGEGHRDCSEGHLSCCCKNYGKEHKVCFSILLLLLFLFSSLLIFSCRLLFEKGELAPVRAYLDRQCAKLREDRVSLRELIFAKEVRLGTYSDRVPPPPAAIVAMKKMANDPQSEPRYGERVPYVVVAGAPSARLIDLVVSPETFISAAGRLRINSTYYITKCVLPSLERVLGLAGADVKGWFAAMPRARSISLHKHSFFADATRAQGGVGGAGMVAAAAVRLESQEPSDLFFFFFKKSSLVGHSINTTSLFNVHYVRCL